MGVRRRASGTVPDVLDHVFTDAIDALGQSLEKSFLERLGVEEHLQVDIMLGDMAWETSYGLLGETDPAKVRADVSLVWPTWSQASFRDWYTGDGFSEPPRIEVEVTLRVQRLTSTPDVAALLAVCPTDGPRLGEAQLFRAGPSVESSYSRDLDAMACAFEVAYTGVVELSEPTLEDGASLDTHFSTLGGWVAAALVKLNDLPLRHLPDDAPEDF